MGLDAGAVAEIWAAGPEPGWSVGSGYLIAGRLLLTAAHAVTFDEVRVPCSQVRVRLLDEGVVREARVVWRGDALLDAALVEITDSDFDPGWRTPVRFGRLVGSAPGVACEAVGFPDATGAFEGPEPLRDSEQLAGRLNPLARHKQGLVDLRVDSWPDYDPEEPSRWSGMSGASVWCGELLVGVVAWDTPGFGQRRLTAVPITALAAVAGFRQPVEQATGRALRCEPVELQDVLAPWFPAQAPQSPAALLRAEHEVVPFTGREQVLEKLQDWCQGEGLCSALLLTGVGGQGKTRVARRLSDLLHDAGWVVGQVTERADVSAHLKALTRCAAPVLLVLDYVETRPDQAQQIIDHLAAHPPRYPVRLLLLARAAGEWFTTLRSASAALSTTVHAEPLDLPPLAESAVEHEEAWQEALTAFASNLQRLRAPDYAGIDFAARRRGVRQPALDASGAGQALALHVAALAALLTGEPSTANLSPQQVLLNHERGYWNRVARHRGLGLDHIRPLAMAAAQLCGPTPRTEALQVLAQLPGLRGDIAEQNRRALADWIHDLYPPPATGNSYWGSLQPDPLAEHYIIEAITAEPTLTTLILPAVGPEQARHALTLLTRAAARPAGDMAADCLIRAITEHSDALASMAIDVATRIESPAPLVQALEMLAHARDSTPKALAALYAEIPKQTHVLADVATALTSQLVTLHRTNGDEANLAGWLNNHSVRLGGLGRWEEALDAITKAVTVYWRLAEARPAVFLPHLAMVLNNQAVQLGGLGRREEALDAITKAVIIRQRLAEGRPEAFLPNLAASLNNQSVRLGELGRREEALEAVTEAVTVYRRLVEARPDAFLPDLAASLNNQSVRLGELGRREEALEVVTEAVTVYRRLVEARPDAFLPDLAASLNNQAIRLGGLGRREEALEVATEAVTVYRRLVEARPEAFLPDLAMALTNQAGDLGGLGRREEALEVATEAVTIRRRLVEARPEAFLPDLALSLTNQAGDLGGLGRREEALEVATEAVTVYRRLAEARPEAFLPDLAMALTNQAGDLGGLGRREEALEAATEAVTIRRRLVEARPEAFLPYLAASLNKQAIRLGELGRREEALEAVTEAVTIRRRLIEARPEAFLPDLAASLTNQAIRLGELGRRGEALEAVTEAVTVYRRLVEARPEAFLPDLAMALTNQAIQVGELGRWGEALEAVTEAVTVYRRLVEARPEAFLPDLAMALNNQTVWLGGLGRREEALEAVTEAVTVYRRLVEVRPDAFLPNLAACLNNQAIPLGELERWGEALEAVTEAVTVYRRLVEARPAVYEPLLRQSLQLRARLLASDEEPD
ncbi:tetratricopeptide repeat protein [Streptomyces sp. NPDC004596]